MNQRSQVTAYAMKTVTILVLIIVCTVTQTANTADHNLADGINKIMSVHYPPDQPGATVLAARSGEVVFRGSYGLASMELQIPVQPEMVFGLASVTKLFTAVAAMMLVDEGTLRLEDEVIDYLPELSKTKGVTIANLLSHTSGMTGPVTKIPGYREENFHREITSRELIASYAEFPLEFTPGERFHYSNEGIAALARIIEIVSKQSWEEFLQQRIFMPVGMKSTYYAGHDRIIPMSVTGYTRHDSSWKRAQYASFTHGFGLGALFSSVDDLFAWYQALNTGRLVKPETLTAMLTPFPLNSGGKSRHGFGFIVSELRGHKLVGHGGGHTGWSTFVAFLPDVGIFVTVLTNRTASEHKAMDDAMAIIKLMLDNSTN